MALVKWQSTVQDEYGNIVVNPSITVRNFSDLSLAPIYDDAGDPMANPFTGTIEGFCAFNAWPGKYVIEGAKGGLTAPDWTVTLDGDMTRPEAVTAVDDGWVSYDGDIVTIGGYAYVWQDGATGIPDLPGLLPSGDATIKHFGAVGDDVANDTTAAMAFVAYANANGGVCRIPKGRYNITGTMAFGKDGLSVIGDGSTATIIDGATVDFATHFDVTVSGFSVLNSPGDAVVFGETAGLREYMAWSSINDIKTNFSVGRGVSFGKVFMTNVTNVRAQTCAGIGIDASSGFNTTLTFSNCHAISGATDGWNLKNICYSSLIDCGSDKNKGYGYRLENLHTVNMLIGAEDCDFGAVRFHYNGATSDIIKGFDAVTVKLFEKYCNPVTKYGTAIANPEIASMFHFTASSAFAVAGNVKLDGCISFSPPARSAMNIESGNYRIDIPKNNVIKTPYSGGSYSVVMGGSTDIAKGIPVNVTGSNTPIATLTPKLANGLNSFGGRLTVYASKNNTSLMGRPSTYEFIVARGLAISGITLISSVGDTAGAQPDSAAFTFNFNTTTNNLEVTPVGSTATGNCYFYFSTSGNLDVIPL